MAHSLVDLVDFLKTHGIASTCEGDARKTVRAVATLEEAGPDDISFLANPKYEKLLATTEAGAVVVGEKQAIANGRTVLRTAEPYAAITALIVRLHGYRTRPGNGISSSATIDPSAQIGAGANIMHGVTISRDVRIGKNAVVYPGVYVAERVRVG